MKKPHDKNIDMKIPELEQKIAELTDGWQRTQADFVNFKKQTADDRTHLIQIANADLIAELLPVLDNFQLAARHLPQELADNNWAQGVQQIEKQFETILSDFGLEKINSVGEVFDPNYHDAVEEVESEQNQGAITEEISAGYLYHNTVLRPAKVKVAR